MDILLVDNDNSFRNHIAEMLRSRGYNVHHAPDGLKGCTILAREEIDLVISDVQMPKFNGLMLNSFVRQMNRYKDTKFVFLSGKREDYTMVRDLDCSVNFFVDKFSSPKTILKFVDKLLFGKYAGTWL